MSTAAATATSWIDRYMSRLTLVCVVGTCLCFGGFGYLLVQNRTRSLAGQKARLVQCRVRPIQVQQEEWFRASGVISDAEKKRFIAALPSEEECAAMLKR